MMLPVLECSDCHGRLSLRRPHNSIYPPPSPRRLAPEWPADCGDANAALMMRL